jgi:hypothetical protein
MHSFVKHTFKTGSLFVTTVLGNTHTVYRSFRVRSLLLNFLENKSYGKSLLAIKFVTSTMIFRNIFRSDKYYDMMLV